MSGVELEFRVTETYVSDQFSNSCSITPYRNVDDCKTRLASLGDCSNCRNCSYCSNCSNCSDCSYCSDCSGCSDCSDCSGCSDCCDCSDCSNCSDQWFGEQFDVPIIADIHQKVFHAASEPGALDMGQWHTCETTHCRAGWVVHLAGDAGYGLESQTSTLFAAQQIYKASGYRISPNRFFDTNDASMADMQRLAEIDAQEKTNDN